MFRYDPLFLFLYRHAASNLDLAVYRAYDPDLGRWLNRDPIGENGGLNLYSYVANEPLSAVDPIGEDVIVLFATKAVCGQGHVATLIGDNNSGWYYHSRTGYDRWPWLHGPGTFVRDWFATLADFKKRTGYSSQYDEAYHIKTDPDRDRAMIEYADEHYNERYHSITPPSNNCADLTEETLAAGGIVVEGDNQYHLRNPADPLQPPSNSPEVPKFLFRNITCSCAGRLWQVPP
jgi:RHS repeat-associated protein